MCGGDGDKFIQNCANYGTITHNGITTDGLYMGGIIGQSYHGIINVENCVSGGKIVNLKQASENNYISAIVGYISSKHNTITNITHCIWTSDADYNDIYGYNGTTVTVTNSSHKELNTETVDGLNEYTENNSTFSKWFMLHLNGGKINDLDQETLIVTQKHFPDPMKEGYTFLFWCLDNDCDERYDSQTTNISEVTNLYAAWNGTYTITFDFGNGTTLNKTLNFNEAIVYPENPTKEWYTFNGWSPKPARMPAEDVTVTAQWTEKPSEFVEIVFGKKDLKKEEIKEIIREYTQEEFVIERLEVDPITGETNAIIKFTDVQKSKELVRALNEDKNPNRNLIKQVKMIRSYSSFSSPFPPLPTFLFMTL